MPLARRERVQISGIPVLRASGVLSPDTTLEVLHGYAGPCEFFFHVGH